MLIDRSQRSFRNGHFLCLITTVEPIIKFSWWLISLSGWGLHVPGCQTKSKILGLYSILHWLITSRNYRSFFVEMWRQALHMWVFSVGPTLHLASPHTMAQRQRYASLFRALQEILFMLRHFICFIIAQWLLRTGSDCGGDQANVVSRDNAAARHAAAQFLPRLLFHGQS